MTIQPFRRIAKSQQGQTLVDLLVAITLLAIAVASAGALATAAARTGSEAGRRTQAATLASREIEAFRNYRDSMARLGTAWSGMPSGNCNPGDGARFVMQRAATTTGWQIVPQAGGVPVSYSNADDTGYDQYNGFSRIVTACNYPGNPNAKAVQVKVLWDESSGQRQVTFSTVITNWKQ